VSGLAAYQDAAHRTRVANAGSEPAARLLGRRQIGKVGTMTLARMDDAQSCGARRVEHRRIGAIVRRSRKTSLPSAAPNPPGSRKSRCMSIMTKLARWIEIERVGFGFNDRHD